MAYLALFLDLVVRLILKVGEEISEETPSAEKAPSIISKNKARESQCDFKGNDRNIQPSFCRDSIARKRGEKKGRTNGE